MNVLKTYLQNVQARLEKATPGPLEIIRFDNDDGTISYQVESALGENHEIVSWHSEHACPKPKANAELIANCPTDLSTLLQIVKIYSKALKTAQADLDLGLQLINNGITDIDSCKQGIENTALNIEKAIEQVNKLVSGGEQYE